MIDHRLSEEYGGMGGDYFALCLALEELARVDSSVAITLEAGVSLGAMPIYRFGSDELKRKWLPELCAGTKLAGFRLTEPGGGSDAGATRTTAVRNGDEWVINGSKSFITNSGTDITSAVTVTAMTGTRHGRKEISAFLVPAGTPGFAVAPRYSKVGWSASDTHGLSFDDCRVPASNLVGERGKGYAQFLRILDEGRIAIAAVSVGLAQGCIDECLRYTRERKAFGHCIGTYQVVQFKLADMETRAHTARLAYYHAASRMLCGEPFKKEAAIAKLVASNAAMDNARDATQIFGGYGFMDEFPVGRFYGTPRSWRSARAPRRCSACSSPAPSAPPADAGSAAVGGQDGDVVSVCRLRQGGPPRGRARGGYRPSTAYLASVASFCGFHHQSLCRYQSMVAASPARKSP